MGEQTAIGWTDHTHNPWIGCRKVSPACANCYFYRDAKRYGRDPKKIVRTAPATFNAPLKWREPAKVFMCSWSDFFIEDADPWRDEQWNLIRRTPHLTRQILTKRPENILDRLPSDWGDGWEHVWFGITAENQEWFDKRWDILKRVPAALRFVSYEPALGPLNIERACAEYDKNGEPIGIKQDAPDWIIAGGESGPNARPSHPQWFRDLRDQCAEVGIPFFFKQWGEWLPGTERHPAFNQERSEEWLESHMTWMHLDGTQYDMDDPGHGCEETDEWLARVGTKVSGSLLDGHEHKEFPE
jgi:protein gp37